MSNQNDGLDRMFDAGAALSASRTIDKTPYVVVPDNFHVENLSSMQDAPPRLRGHTTLRDEESFIAFVNLHKTDNTDLYYSIESPAFLAVFNAPRAGAPAWGDHKAGYQCPVSPQWQQWQANDGKRMGQEDFALFVERNLPDIVDPVAADLLEIVTTLQAKKKVNFVSGLRLSNGANEFTYEEQIDGSAAKGKLQIPEEITLGIPVFVNGAPYAVQAKFRYRITEGKLAMWYELVRPHVIVEDAVKELRQRIETATGLVGLNGTPA